jgi:hypothetical protein
VPNSTDVRQWLKDQGAAPGSRGQLAPDAIDAYNQAHPDTPYEPPRRRAAAQPAGDSGVSEDDFPAAPLADEPPPSVTTGEQPPAAVKPSRRAGFTKIFQRPAKAGRRKARGPRQDLSDWAQDMWADLAWIAAPMPPVAMMLSLQAPYAGSVVDSAIKGTILDRPAQLAAKYDTALRALDGLIGPPLFTAAICVTGQIDEHGIPDNRTRGLLMGLRYSLKQMLRTSDMRAEEIEQRAQEMTARDLAIDTIIAKLFGWPVPQPAPPGDQAPQQQPGPSREDPAAVAVLVPSAMFKYPEAQAGQGSDIMDGAGKDKVRS